MKQIILGKNTSDNSKLEIDLPVLIDTRLLIQANSGGGKSYAVRKLLEETHGKVQQIVLDMEGEFATLREKYAYLLCGKNGDIPINPRMAGLLAKKILELKTSTIIDLYELKQHERISFVKEFLESMINAPKHLWHACLVVVDEAHVFAPEKRQSEATNAVIDLCTRGRKRGYCAVLATQRLSKLSKDAAAELTNELIGRTGLDVDMKRASEILGFTSKEQTISLRKLNPGEFFAFGPALSDEVIKAKIGKVKTTHPKAGSRQLKAVLPPTPGKIKSLLSKLKDLPQEVETDLKEKKEMLHKIRELKLELRKKPHQTTIPDSNQLEKAQERGIAIAKRNYEPHIKQLEKDFLVLKNHLSNIIFTAQKALGIPKSKLNILTIPRPMILKEPLRKNIVKVEKKIIPIDDLLEENGTNSPGPGAIKILKAVAKFHPEPLTKIQVATISRFSAKGGTYGVYLSRLKKMGWVKINNGKISITETGLDQTNDIEQVSTNPNDLVEFWAKQVRGGAGKILKAVAEQYPDGISKEELGEITNFTITGGTFTVYLSRLKSCGLIKVEGDNVVATKWLFLEN